MFSQGKAPGHSPSTSAHNPPPSPSTALETELVTMGGRERNWLRSQTPPTCCRQSGLRETKLQKVQAMIYWIKSLPDDLVPVLFCVHASSLLYICIRNEFPARKWSPIRDGSVMAHIALLRWALLLLPLSITIMCESAMNNWQQLRPFL